MHHCLPIQLYPQPITHSFPGYARWAARLISQIASELVNWGVEIQTSAKTSIFYCCIFCLLLYHQFVTIYFKDPLQVSQIELAISFAKSFPKFVSMFNKNYTGHSCEKKGHGSHLVVVKWTLITLGLTEGGIYLSPWKYGECIVPQSVKFLLTKNKTNSSNIFAKLNIYNNYCTHLIKKKIMISPIKLYISSAHWIIFNFFQITHASLWWWTHCVFLWTKHRGIQPLLYAVIFWQILSVLSNLLFNFRDNEIIVLSFFWPV